MLVIRRPGSHPMSAHLKEAPLTVDKEYVADLAVTAAAKGKELVWAPGAFRYVMMVLRHIPGRSSANSPSEQMASRRKGPTSGTDGAFASARAANVLASIAHMVIAAAIAAVVAVVSLKAIGRVNCRLPVVESATRADHGGPGRVHRRVGATGGCGGAVSGRLGVGRLAALVFVSAFPLSRWPCRWAPPSSTCSDLGGPAVPHRVSDPVDRQRRPARYDLSGSAAVLPAGWF
ncbi:arabinofuranosyltransferase AftA domain protein [Mycobacterium xenopi 4042]|uniref:Arabinofuranosyltransferase AftA domain protein n=1 Tax=Mycobacterium xenopi 4042 TaxID=1299334 RepID=X8DIW5_MYCXE|nr:arabinofuranosyltransferase AftA domain protein [Mycobacterium xenopi 4042]